MPNGEVKRNQVQVFGSGRRIKQRVGRLVLASQVQHFLKSEIGKVCDHLHQISGYSPGLVLLSVGMDRMSPDAGDPGRGTSPPAAFLWAD